MTTVTTSVPEGLTREQYEAFLAQFADTRAAINRVAAALEAQEQPVGPNTAAQLSQVELLWRHLIETYGVYTSADIATLRGGSPTSRSIATTLAREYGLIGFRRGRPKVYPRFEFLGRNPHPRWREIVTPLRESGVDDEEILLWMVSANPYLGGAEPAALLEHAPERVAALTAEEASGRWF
ncbi:hypothetical protein [Raineyella sp. W15-4]|uniref:hypothetical protein n=1 Tax=Raineyella sp. W15-4 TaxID=3081651 RepID=UPI002952A942|nr:hypothetical protein [Raineyella sp. W15-4]WOQ17101.1 hypothetical protein R0145_18180 [Raineyella sp. W15-4]